MTYPIDLRQRVIDKGAQGAAPPQIAKDLAVSSGWVNKILQCHATCGTPFPPRKKPGRTHKPQGQHRAWLRDWLAECPELALAPMAAGMQERPGIRVNNANIADALKAMKHSCKKSGRARRAAAP